MAGVSESAFRRYYGDVYRYLRRRTGNPGEAEELTQQVFADAAAAERRLEQDGRPLLPWLLAVARRRWVDERRHAARAERLVDAVGAAATRGDGSRVDDARAVRAALAQLPVEQREVIVRRLWADATFKEIARELGLSEGAAKMRFRRGLESLRELLKEEHTL
ncbi:MAG TPA: sigma-70 family RNA polymerase sigma factor [Gaiellaceae bacterium]|nr:sigma-70 family RNA polymerase sigma factor [Gaiellaceae bacterium]